LRIGYQVQQTTAPTAVAAMPIGRMANPEDLTGMAIFLASSESDYVVSQTYNVDGGQWMS
jgi:D-sorbitol dehydrogenase (acceptor)